MKQTFTHNRHLQICAALIAADCFVFTLVDPQQASALWLITGYILMGLTLFGVASLLASCLKSYGLRTQAVGRRFLRYSAIIGVVLLGLQSIGQLTVKDVIALLPLAVIAYLYFGYGKKLAPEKV
jgi:hypothetical protein